MRDLTIWHTEAVVRSRPRRVLQYHPDALFFPSDSLSFIEPVLSKVSSEDFKTLTILRLQQILRLNSILEAQIVIPACLDIQSGEHSSMLNRSYGFGAMHVSCDESYHAIFFDDMADQVASLTHLDLSSYVPAVLPAVKQLLDSCSQIYRPLVLLAAAIVSETNTAGAPVAASQDERLQPSIRELFADHDFDEERHYWYFRDILQTVWPALEDEARVVFKGALVDALAAFVTPDVPMYELMLSSLSLSSKDRAGVVDAIKSSSSVASRQLKRAAPFISVLESTGVLQDEELQSMLRAGGLKSAPVNGT